MADLTSLILTDLLETFLSFSVFTQRDERIQQWTNYNGATGILDC